MSFHAWKGEKRRRAISSTDLQMRLDINKKCQSKDFQAWVRKRLAVRTGEQILDVGCGTGAQTLFMAEDAGESGRITSFDISKESIESLKASLHPENAHKVSAYALDMAEIDSFLEKDSPNKKFTLAQSSYALYYSPKRIEVLSMMQRRTKPYGRVAVFTPCAPHGMIEFASKHHAISEQVTDSLHFGDNILRPLFRKCFSEVELHYFQSSLIIKSELDFRTFYEATTYYDEQASDEVCNEANKIIAKNGFLEFKKCGVLLIGSGVNALANEF